MKKINYNLMMKKQLENIKGKPKLLLHVCCAPCSAGVIPVLKEHFDISLFYYNPNTYPKDEYLLRAEEFSKLTDLPLIVCDYNHNEFLNTIKGYENDIEHGTRCQKCIELRLMNSFQYAKMYDFDYVTTSLSVSPYKDSEFINNCGERLEQFYAVKFLYSDFKKDNGFLNSINTSKQLGLYRQEFCGCEFSHNNKKNVK